MKQFRIEQDDVDSCRVLLRVSDAGASAKEAVEMAVHGLLKGRIEYNVHYVDEIKMGAHGKTKILISKLTQRSE